MSFAFEKVSYAVPLGKGEKKCLDDVGGVLKAGEVLAVRKTRNT